MWSTVFASVARPSSRHCWHRCLSLLRTTVRNRSHLVPYPRSCRLLPCWWFSQPVLRCSSQYPLRSVVVFAQPRLRHARGIRGGIISSDYKACSLWTGFMIGLYRLSGCHDHVANSCRSHACGLPIRDFVVFDSLRALTAWDKRFIINTGRLRQRRA